jgi:hypothetical protein
MQLVALLVVVVVMGVLMSRLGGGWPHSPLSPPSPPPAQTLQRVEKEVDAAGAADAQRLNDAMKGLR